MNSFYFFFKNRFVKQILKVKTEKGFKHALKSSQMDFETFGSSQKFFSIFTFFYKLINF